MNYDALHLDPDEHVTFQVRKHWIVFASRAIGLVFIALLPLFLFTFFGVFAPGILSTTFPGNPHALFVFFYSLWLLAIWLSFFVEWTTFYLDAWYVTEKRIIIIDQKGIFDRDISNIRFDKIQDVSVEVSGFISTFLQFGTVRVQTASEDNTEFVMTVVKNPDEVRKVIFAQHNFVHDA